MRKKENGRKMKWGEWEKGRKGEKENPPVGGQVLEFRIVNYFRTRHCFEVASF